MKSLFHYTKALHLGSICRDRVIRTAPSFGTSERQAVWCSIRQDFEPTAAVAQSINGIFKPMSCEQMAEAPEFNPVRIEVNPSSCPHNWNAYKALSGISSQLARGLEKVARNQGSRPADWYVSFVPLPANQWISVAYYYKRKWRVFPLNDAILQHFSIVSVEDLRRTVDALSPDPTNKKAPSLE